MERSIEKIWKKGFEAEEKLSAPVISNLYKRKSKLVIQQINNTAKKDNFSLIPVAIIISVIFLFTGKIILAIYASMLLIALFFVNKKLLANLETIDIRDNTYNYLLNYRKQVKNIICYSTWIVGLGLPLVIIPGYWLFFYDSKLMDQFLVLDRAVQILLVLSLALLFSFLGILAYRLSTRIVYGKLLTKLETTIKDMEDLMKA